MFVKFITKAEVAGHFLLHFPISILHVYHFSGSRVVILV
jgi:hypothetical protein